MEELLRVVVEEEEGNLIDNFINWKIVFADKKIRMNKKNVLITVILMVAFESFFSLNALSQTHQPIGSGGVGSWRLLGERVIDFKADKDLINVIGNDIFRKLKFKIIDAPVFMADMKVMFENGQVQDIPLQFTLQAGHESRIIDLIGSARRIKVVYFNYKTARPGYRGKGKLILFGMK